MSINIHWGYQISDQHPFYAALSDDDKRFLLPESIIGKDVNLIGLMLVSHISFISSETIPSLCARVCLLEGRNYMHQLDELARNRDARDFAHYLERFIGVASNIQRLSTSDFGKVIASELPKMTAADIRKYDEGRRRVIKKRLAEKNPSALPAAVF